jgi:hypothetical protein
MKRSLRVRLESLERLRGAGCLACAIERIPVIAMPEETAPPVVQSRPCQHPAGLGLAGLIRTLLPVEARS